MSVSDIESALRPKLGEMSELDATVKVDFGDDHLFIDGKKAPATLTHADEDADCTLTISAEDLQKILDGELDATMAFMTGKLKVKGSTPVAMKLAGLLKS